MTIAVILLSGGMDSGVLLAQSAQQFKSIVALSFTYGSKHNASELRCADRLAQQFASEHITVQLPFLDEIFHSSLLASGPALPLGQYTEVDMRSTVVPFRNGIFLSIAVGLAEDRKVPAVLIGSHAGDRAVYPDCRAEFSTAFSEAAALGTYQQVRVLTPFAQKSKADIARIGRSLDFDFSLTWSCYAGSELHCGACAACLERKSALEFSDAKDPTSYQQ